MVKINYCYHYSKHFLNGCGDRPLASGLSRIMWMKKDNFFLFFINKKGYHIIFWSLEALMVCKEWVRELIVQEENIMHLIYCKFLYCLF
jgi:hypothetical protein